MTLRHLPATASPEEVAAVVAEDGVITRSKTCREFIMNPLVLGAVGQVLSKATTFQLHLTQVISIGAGEPAQLVHRDQWAFDFFPFPKGHEVSCNTLWAMTDFTE